MSSEAWGHTHAWGLTPDFDRMKVTKPSPAKRSAKLAVPRAFKGAKATDFAMACVLAAIAKCEGGDATVVVDGQGGTQLFPLLNPFCNRAEEPFGAVVEALGAARKAPESATKRVGDVVAQLRSSTEPRDATRAAVGSTAVLSADAFATLGEEAAVQAFDATFVVSADGVELVHDERLFAVVHARDRAEHVAAIAEAVGSDAEATLAQLPSTTAAMRQRLLCEWQAERFPVSAYNRTLNELFVETCEKRCDAAQQTAIVEASSGRSITYADMLVRARKIARMLHREHPGVRWGDDATCGIHLPRGVDWFVVMLGVHMAGGAYLSLDPAFPPDRLLYSLQDADSVCLFTLRETVDVLGFEGATIALDDDAWAAIDAEDDSGAFESPTRPDSPAYLLYTSGSTGKPKGVCVEHHSVVNFLISEIKMMDLDNTHRIFQCATTSFDTSVEEIWLPFATGSVLVQIDKPVLQDPEQFGRLIQQHKCTFLSVSPTLIATIDPAFLGSIKFLLVGGEACTQDVVAAHATCGRRLINSYGPTEATVACVADELKPGRPITIGRAMPGYFACIVNSKMELLPPGVAGELCIAGPSVTRGYVKRDDLTKEKFAHCPYVATPKPEFAAYDDETANDASFNRLYHTGDLCRYNAEGLIEFLGRIDLQIKLRGYRIEIEEIENVLQSYPGVQLAVVSKRSQFGVEFLCAYLQFKADYRGEGIDESAFPPFLRQKLPAYMVPSRYVRVEQFARIPSGKIDRKALPEPPALERNAQLVEPKTDTEREVLAVWEEVFMGLDISTEDDFFDDLGGSSILVGKTMTKLREMGYDVSSRSFYSNPTIVKLAAFLEKQSGSAEPPQPHLPQSFKRPTTLRRNLFAAWQLLFTLISCANLWLLLLPIAIMATEDQVLGFDIKIPIAGFHFVVGILLAVAIQILQLTFLLVFLPLLKWLIVGQVTPGQHWIYSWFFLRWWTVRALYDVFPAVMYTHMYIVGFIYRLAGAKIGASVLMPGVLTDPDLVTIGDDVYIAANALLLTSQVTDQQLVLKRIRVGSNVCIDAAAVLDGGAVVPDGCVVKPMATVRESSELREGCVWAAPGVIEGDAAPLPAGRGASGDSLLQQRRPARQSKARRVVTGLIQVVSFTIAYACMALIHCTLIYEMVYYGHQVNTSPYLIILILMLALPGTIVAGTWWLLMSVAWRYIVMPFALRPGSLAITSARFQCWVMFQKVTMLGSIMYPVANTVFAARYYKLLGMDVGDRTEFGILGGWTPNVTHVGEDCFLADMCVINPPLVHGGHVTFQEQYIRDGALVGNNSVVSAREVGAKAIVGAACYVCEDLPAATVVTGAPAVTAKQAALPDDVEMPSELRDGPYRATRATLVVQGLHNVIDIFVGQWFIFMSIAIATGSTLVFEGPSIAQKLVALYMFVIVLEVSKASMLIWAKWAINGRIRAFNLAADSPLCCRYLSQFGLMMAIMPMGMLYVMRGSVWFPLVLRALGMRVGENCFIDTIQIPETDLATVGDDCSINASATLGTHIAENHFTRNYIAFGESVCGSRVTLGSNVVLAPTASVSDGCSVAANSGVSLGESLAPRTHWSGLPVERVKAPPLLSVSTNMSAADDGAATVEMKKL